MVQKVPNSSVVQIMNPTHKMVEFSPAAGPERFTDPSYHLPAFYELWSRWASQDKAFWKAAADTSRVFFKRACHPVTGLATDYQDFNGTPKTTSFNANSATFNADSWRVAMNIGMDYAWFRADDWQVTQSVRLLNFFNGKGAYKSAYSQDGATALVTYQSEGHIAMNAVAALASNDTIAYKFVNALWAKPISTGTYRYYNGLLQMMALLHCSGKYVIWGRDTIPSTIENSIPNQRPSGSSHRWDLTGRLVQ
jgi:oligosaccharide reducing-end xylanase